MNYENPWLEGYYPPIIGEWESWIWSWSMGPHAEEGWVWFPGDCYTKEQALAWLQTAPETYRYKE